MSRQEQHATNLVLVFVLALGLWLALDLLGTVGRLAQAYGVFP